MSDVAQPIPATPAMERVANEEKSVLGFWVYLMTDCVLFASLFAVYAVMQGNTNGGPGPESLFSLMYVYAETIVLLTSSFICGLAMLAVRKKDKPLVLAWMSIVVVLGLIFLALEVQEFQHLVREGNSWQRSGYLSSYFTLIGTHGLHIFVGLLWAAVLMVQVVVKGLTHGTVKRLTLFSLFWHFLDVIWIFIFSIVYLLGAL